MQQIGISEPVVLGGVGKLLTLRDLGIRIGFEEVRDAVRREAKINAGVAV